MSKRTQSIRSLFAAEPGSASAENVRPPVERVASGAVRSLKDTFSEVERDYEELKRQVSSGAVPVELDTELLDPSPFADRFADQDLAAVEALKTSFQEHGQEIPILVRLHPTSPGRYQIAYGHRRVRAASDLGLKIKAYIRELDDDRLIVAQGVENSAREDLTFIERATFALRLEDGGFQRALIQTALSVDRQEASKLVTVARAVPQWIVAAIGRAPKIGRPRWQELAELLKQPGTETKVRRAASDATFQHKDSDDRFALVLRAAKAKAEPSPASPGSKLVAKLSDGTEIAKLAISGKSCKIQLDRARDEDFASFLMQQLPALYLSFKDQTQSSNKETERK